MKKFIQFLLLLITIVIHTYAQDVTMSANGTYTVCSGNFYDGGGPLNDYPNNQNVIVTLKPATAGAKISVTFNSFATQTHYYDISQNGSYDDDILYVYNGSNQNQQIGALQGQAGYGTITSTASDGSLTFKFVSHTPAFTPPNGSRAGWSATISCNYTPTDITMIASGSFTTCGGNFYDSGGPNGDYMNNQNTIMPSGGTVVTIYPLNKTDKLSITFNSFNTQTHYYDVAENGSYDDDILYVYNGNNQNQQIGALQGQAGYGTITSTASDGSLTFKFVSHTPAFTPPSGSRAGWSATISCNYTPTDITMIASGSFTTCGGNFYDSGGPNGDYMNNQNTITPSGGTVVTIYPLNKTDKLSITFNSFNTQTHYYDVAQNGSYDDDILYVYNGSNQNQQIGALQGQAGYGTITSTASDGSLTFKFVSHTPAFTPPNGSRAGWSATISCNYTPTDITMIASGSFTTCGGNFYDSGGPNGDYMNNQNTIMPSGGTVVTIYPLNKTDKLSITFNSFNTQTHYYDVAENGSYDDDILYVYNGNNQNQQIGALQGQAGYGTITSTASDGSLTFKFVSHTPAFTPPSGSRAGWSATISCNYTPTDITMIASGSFTTCGGNFYDSGGPNGDYMNNQNTITPSGGTVVTIYPLNKTDKLSITFNSFNTQTHYYDVAENGSYDDDILYVYNGNNQNQQIGALQGQAGYGTITSTASDGSLTFKFVSHTPAFTPPSGSRAGWSATISCNYTPTDITMIASGSFTTCGGNFYDSGGPNGDYMNNQNTITPSGGTVVTIYPACSNNKVSVSFSSFNTQTNYYDVAENGTYDNDILYVYNGPNTISYPLIATLMGSTNPGIITSTASGGSLTFKFVSHSPAFTPPSGSRAGWSASISCVCSNPVGGTPIASPSSICSGETSTLTLSGYSGCSIQWQSSSTNNTNSFTDINGQTNPTYTTPPLLQTMYYRAMVSTDGLCGKTNSSVITITVKLLPLTPVISASSKIICQGDTTTLNANSNGCDGCTYTWSPSTGLNTTIGASVLAYPTTSTTYTVTASNNCPPNSSSLPISIAVNPLPPRPTITLNGSILTSSSSTAYQWYLNDTILNGKTLQTLVAGRNGNYKVVATDSNGCKATSAPYLYSIVGIEKLTKDNDLIIIPNPNDGHFRIKANNLKFGKIKIYNSIGDIIYQSFPGETEINLFNEVKGIYFIEIEMGNKTINKKLVILN